MGNLLQLQNASKSFGTKELFSEATFAINEGEHVGVIGPNGAGKTTLFKVLIGLEQLDGGDFIKSKGLKIGYLEQESEWNLESTPEEYLGSHCTKPLWELKELGRSLGISDEQFLKPLKLLSGGFRMRVKLLYLIGQEPTLMLLDEPTNFLDLESVLALETFLRDYEGAFLLISHDREFLRRTTVATLEVEGGDITKFPGNIDDYFEQKAQLAEILAAQVANQEAKRKHIQGFIDRFGAKATKAKQAQSRMKQLEKMEKIEVKDLPIKARIHIPEPIHTGKQSLEITRGRMGYGENCILSDVNLSLERGDHIGIVGFNGAGKSTLLKSLAGEIPLLAGEVKLGYQVTLSIFNQHSADQLVLTDTVIESLGRAAHFQTTSQEILGVAGSLLFSGSDLKKKISVLSGGEKTRVALGQLLLRKSPLILLDEPTNHLDFDTVMALTDALKKYSGTVVVVSHDRSFIGSISKKLLEIANGHVHLYPGTYDEYVWSLERGALSERKNIEAPVASVVESVVTKKTQTIQPKAVRAKIKDVQKKILALELSLSGLEKDREVKTGELIAAKGEFANEISKLLGSVSAEIQKKEDQLLEFMEELERLETSLAEIVS